MTVSHKAEAAPNDSLATDCPSKKILASQWFATLRGRICAELEQIETELTDTQNRLSPGKFERTAWKRKEGGGGEMSLMRGRVFEKAGVNISTVHGEFSESMRKEMPGADQDPRFWASGISVVVHPRSPLVPAVHMNTRFVIVGGESPESRVQSSEGRKEQGARQAGRACHQPAKRRSMESSAENSGSNLKSWFGGGADLTPVFPDDKDTADFHAAFQKTCDAANPDYYGKYKTWCDEYFFLQHRNESRGAGGIFYDYLNSGDWEADFAFTQSVGETFLAIYPRLVRRHMNKPWTDAQREQQLQKRGRYVEFNLLYDRGTRFGLMTGGNVEAILMSLPPEVRW